MKKLGLDIDETMSKLLQRFLTHHYNPKYGTDHNEEEFHVYHWWKILGTTKQEAYSELDEFISTHVLPNDSLTVLPLDHGAKEAVERLSRRYEIHLITNRGSLLQEHTDSLRKLLNDHAERQIITADRIHYPAREGMKKSDVCKAHGIATIIDDDADVAKDCAENGIDVVLLSRPWNRQLHFHRIHRVRDIIEASEYLLREEQQYPASDLARM